ncbi:unnamed protein product [Soboliphyme baturini]|uniref:ERAP1_C domain-containing protein n=1 Tax=Soboliphyme baturini TaxID=241478 RepID=A0A183JAV2_9BILA|nr:unnamed protein product [Soboliphyme baturini]
MTVYCAGAANGGYDGWKFLWELYKRETQPVESISLLYGICCTRIPSLISKIMEQSITDKPFIRRQDVGNVFAYLQSNAIASKMAWDFFVTNIKEILRRCN